MNIIAVIDFGGQYSQLITRRIRELKVYSLLVSYDKPADYIKKLQPCGLIFTGGPSSVNSADAIFPDDELFSLGIPILGICYGHQLMVKVFGGEVVSGASREYGQTELKVLSDSKLYEGTPADQICWMSHGDFVSSMPEDFRVTARTGSGEVASMESKTGQMYGVQFHPEVRHTQFGMRMLENFAVNVCGCKQDWTPSGVIEAFVREIRTTVGGGRAVCALSGGIDSSTAAMLAHRAIGERLNCVFVDHGLLRKNEAEEVKNFFTKNMRLNLTVVDARERFLAKLKGVVEPERKRKIIGEEFIRVFEEQAEKIGDIDYLVQGTLYSDVIESGSRTAAKIKSHHNVGGLPEVMKLKLIEPLRNIFKDEAREIARELGITDEIVQRHPFPGPGLAIRIIGEVTQERLEILRESDAIIEQEIRGAGLYNEIWQAFAVLPAIKSVGVMGDSRTYAYPIVVRAVKSDDAMTADWVRLPYELLARVSNRIINEVKGVNRVVYDISSKPPSTIEWE